MHIFDLPLELFTAIIEQTVYTLGLQRSLRARLSDDLTGHFSDELIHCICVTGVLVTASSLRRTCPDKFLIQSLRHRALNIEQYAHPLFAALKHNADFVLSRGKLGDIVECLDEACRCMTTYLHPATIAGVAENSPKVLLDDLGPDEEAFGLRTMAAWMGDLDYLQATANSLSHQNDESYFSGSPACAAARRNHTNILQFLSERCPEELDMSVVFYYGAGISGHQNIARELTDQRRKFDLKASNFSDAIREAAQHGHLEVLQFLLDRSNFTEDELSAALSNSFFHACFGGHTEIVKYLLPQTNPRDATFPDSRGSCLHAACHRGYAGIVALLLPAIGPDFMTFARQPRLEDPLAQAAKFGHVPVVRILLQHGAPVDGTHSTDGYSTPLCRAAERGQYAVAELTLDSGASVEGKIGANIMVQAIRSGEESMVRLLAERGCDINEGFFDDRPPIAVAVEERQWAIQRLLEQLGAKNLPSLDDEVKDSQ